VRKQKAFFLFLISIAILSFLFTSCDTSQIKTTEAETTVTSIEEIAVAEVITTEETSDKENKAAAETTNITDNEETEETTAQATETTEITTEETKTSETNQPLKVHFINVGQGDSILIVTPEGNTMLIDGGPKDSGADLVSYLKKQGINKINVIVATHPHEDHIGGLINVINSFKVDNIIDSGVSHTTQTYKNYLSAIQSKNINFVNWSLGQQFDFGNNISFTIVGPITKSSSDLNNSSIVIYFKYNKNTFLFAGDAQSVEEGKIVSSGADINADVLKVGHHGSDSSSSSNFLKAVSPSIAIISCGAGNSYGHPHDITLKNLTDIGAVIYRTDLIGTIVIECDGKSVTVVAGKPYTYTKTKTTETTQVVETTAAETTSVETTAAETVPQTGAYVGSVKSDVFHYPNCRYVKKILPENMIWFTSRDDAIAQGYRPCKVCNP
jgi:beta-lactamase superfamily II metal-dependent hydrolase